jgi:hypothetical protein
MGRVPEQYAAGVESYLIEQLDPRLRPDSIGSAVRVPVNLPIESFTAATISPRRPSTRRP